MSVAEFEDGRIVMSASERHPGHETFAAPELAHGENAVDVTVVLPCYNEREHVVAELERITAAMDASEFSWELLVIDDKSTDDTLRCCATRCPGSRTCG